MLSPGWRVLYPPILLIKERNFLCANLNCASQNTNGPSNRIRTSDLGMIAINNYNPSLWQLSYRRRTINAWKYPTFTSNVNLKMCIFIIYATDAFNGCCSKRKQWNSGCRSFVSPTSVPLWGKRHLVRLNKRKWNMLFMDSISDLDCQQVESQTGQFALRLESFILWTLDFKRFASNLIGKETHFFMDKRN